MKPFIGVQLVKVQPGQSRSGQAGSACCHSSGDWRVRSVHSKEAGREDSAPTSLLIAMPTPLAQRKAASRKPIGEVILGSPESLARGMLSKGFPANLGELPTSREHGPGYAQTQRNQVPGARGITPREANKPSTRRNLSPRETGGGSYG